MRRTATLALTVALLATAAAFANPAGATFPGAKGRIAFYRFDPALAPSPVGRYDLYTANPDGSHVIQVTNAPGFSSDWSADGKHLAYDFFDADGNEQIGIANPDGTGTQQLTQGPAIHEVPSFSPDGTRIVYGYSPTPFDASGFHPSLWLMKADGSNQHQLVPDTPDTFDSEPRFSPDGQRIAFVRIRKNMGQAGQQNALFVMRLDGGEPQQLTPWGQGQSIESPDWSPDGRWITYYIDDQGAAVSPSIYLIRPDGSKKHKIFGGQANSGGARPVFSPDGTKILFACVTFKPQFDVDLCTMSTDGSNVVDITNTRTVGELESRPSWGTAAVL